MNPWYQAWLQPDCMVGANTNARRAMAQNRPLSDTFKQRLRACMDSEEYDKLTRGAPPVQYTARMPRSHDASPRDSVRARKGSVQASTGPPSVTGRRVPSATNRAPSRSVASRASSERTTSAGRAPSLPRQTETRVPSAEIREIMRAGRASSPVVQEISSRARVTADRNTDRPGERRAAAEQIQKATQAYLNNMKKEVAVSRDAAELTRIAEDLAQHEERFATTVKTQTAQGLGRLRQRALQKADIVGATVRKKDDARLVNQDAEQLYRELNAKVVEAGAANTPDDRRVMTTTIEAIDLYVGQNIDLLNAKNTRVFQQLRQRCERLAMSVSVQRQTSGGTVRGSAGPPDSFTGPYSSTEPVQAPRRAPRRRRPERAAIDDEWASMYQAYADTANQAIKENDEQAKLDVASDITKILQEYKDVLFRKTQLRYERLLKKVMLPRRATTHQQHRAVVQEAKAALRNKNRSRDSIQKLIDQLADVPERYMKGNIVRPLYDLLDDAETSAGIGGGGSAEANSNMLSAIPVAPFRHRRGVIESDDDDD